MKLLLRQTGRPRLLAIFLLVLLAVNNHLYAQQVFHIGLDFIESDTDLLELPQAILGEPEPIVDITYRPVTLTAPDSFAVTQGGLTGYTESDIRESIRFAVEEIYRDIVPPSMQDTLSINFYNGPAPTSAAGRRLNVVIGSNDLITQIFGFSQGNAAFNVSTHPDDSYAAAVFANNLDSIGADPSVTFSTAESVINNYAGTIAHEIGHLFGLDHQNVGVTAPYSLMAIGGTGLTLPQRLTERRFNATSSADLLALLPTSNRADFNMDGDVDIFQFDGGGDVQILINNLGIQSGASLSEGDANSDGDVDVFQIDGEGDAQLLLSNLNVDAAAGVLDVDGARAFAKAFYNPNTGEVIFEIGSGINVFGLETSADQFDTTQVPTLDGFEPGQFDSRVLAYFTTSSYGLPAGTYKQGKILPAGLTESELQFGATGIGITLLGSLVFIPEPSSALLVSISFCLISWCRRRG